MNKTPLLRLSPVPVPAGAAERVIAVVEARQKTSRLWRIRLAVSTGIVSLGGLVPVGISLVRDIASSHAGAYLSLVFSDTSIALSYWKEIGASLLESVPFLALTGTLALLGLLLWSLRLAARSIATPLVITNA